VLLRLRLIWLVDFLRLSQRYLRSYAKNQVFIRQHADFVPPPLYIQFETTNSVDHQFFYDSGLEQAKFVVRSIGKHLPKAPISVFDWGCGAAKVIRHLPSMLPSCRDFCASDYNKRTIRYAGNNFPSISFVLNGLLPPLTYVDKRFDCVYSISVLTHLSEEIAKSWISELHRIMKPGGILILTLNGDYRKSDFSEAENTQYQRSGILVRSASKEGKKWFSAYHHPNYVRDVLLQRFEILAWHQMNPSFFGQDVWISCKAPS
jgi:SAM-dependent methyltransferase